jgi:dTDP-6-deoxy-L-talose 4-dehydrogenase (NAD+)
VDTIIHAAWFVEHSSYLKAIQNLDCLKGTISLAEAAARRGVRRFVGIGTCFEYDDTPGFLSTATPLLPRTLYGCSKAATFMTLSGFLPQQGVEFLWCRLFYLYGAGEKPTRLFPYLHRQLKAGLEVNLTSGDQIRDFLDVEIAATEILDLAAGDMQGAVNICSGIPISVRQFAERVADQYGRRSMLRFGTRPDNLQDPPLLVGVKSVLQERAYES